jgi:hypothetical protein
MADTPEARCARCGARSDEHPWSLPVTLANPILTPTGLWTNFCEAFVPTPKSERSHE